MFPITQDLVLIGGGHSHAIALKKLGMKPLPGVQLTLISDVSHTPYSGMLPGYVAGLYSYDECHIDLRPLAHFAGARMILDRAIGLDLQNHRVICEGHPAIAFDRLSIDIGSTPSLATVPGAREYAIPVKPISQFLQRWDALLERLQHPAAQPFRVGVVGGGGGGVELALAVQARLQGLYQAAGVDPSYLELHLFHKGETVLSDRQSWVRYRLQRILQQRGMHLHLGETVRQVEPDWVGCESGLQVPMDLLFWVTQATAAGWIKDSGLATDERGFIQVNDTLQSLSHPQVFAAGDIATLVNHPRPKAGVFAVRAGKPLTENLRRSLLGQPLRPFIPQKEFLILIGLGDRRAVASRGALGLGPTGWLWNWKDAIDRKFMNQFADLQPMRMSQSAVAPTNAPTNAPTQLAAALQPMRCSGCGSKIGSSILTRSLQRLQQDFPHGFAREDVLLGLAAPDDAAVLQVPAAQVMVQTVDYFRALVDDPFVFGQIATQHCLSDLFAMGASPQSALAIATLPLATDPKLEEMLYQLLSGCLKTLQSAGAVLVGGHTTEGTELAFGLTCNGLAQPERLLKKGGMRVGDRLILTKPLGTGTLFAANMQLRARGRWIESALESMLQSNQIAAEIFQQTAAALHPTGRTLGCTDITGFGLLGHLAEMLQASGVAAELQLSAIPLLPGAAEAIAQGYFSSLHFQNLKVAHLIQEPALAAGQLGAIAHPAFALLFDPQTSGGLLASLPADAADHCLERLQSSGYVHSAIIGQVVPVEAQTPTKRLRLLP